MQIEYTLTKEDFLKYQLYTASKSPTVIKQRQMLLWGFPTLWILLGLFYLIFKSNFVVLVLFLILSAIWMLIISFLSKRQYKKFYSKHIDQHWVDQEGQTQILNIEADSIKITDQLSEEKLEINAISELIELKEAYILQTKLVKGYVIPKTAVSDQEGLKTLFQKLNIPYLDETNWVWK